MACPIEMPPGAVAQVSIIDTSLRLSNLPVAVLMQPPLPGFDTFPPLPSWCFMIESPCGQAVLYDLSAPSDLTTFSPARVADLANLSWTITSKSDMASMLRSRGIPPSSIDAIIWSHNHFDHIGDLSTFPSTTKLIVGPGFKASYFPGYPANPESFIKESDYRDRHVVEVALNEADLKIGPFQAHDLFANGSFYLLVTPGHAPAHLAGLARTSFPENGKDTFVLMAGDIVHHASELRPSPGVPLPAEWAHLTQLNTSRGRKADEPFFEPSVGWDIPLAKETIRGLQAFDAREDVLVVAAHDASLASVVGMDGFSRGDGGWWALGRWRENGWKEKERWKFLDDFQGSQAKR